MRCAFTLTMMLSLFVSAYGTTMAEEPAKQDAEKENKEVINLTVYPAALPRPVLKYRLLPTYLEKTPGNAALLYHRVILSYETSMLRMDENNSGESTLEKIDGWMHVPVKDFPQKEVEKVLEAFSLNEIEFATRRMECDWGFPIQESKYPFKIVISEVQESRNIARIIAVNARLQIAQNNPIKAWEYLRLGYPLSKHVGEAPFFVSLAVGNAIAQTMNQQMLDYCQLKDAPNLYWSLTNLPHPLVDPRKANEFESVCLFMGFKELQEAKTGSHSPEQWQELWNSFIEKFNVQRNAMAGGDKMKGTGSIDAKKTLEEKYSFVCEQMKSSGWSEKDIAAKSPAHLMLLYTAELCEEASGEAMKCFHLPYAQLPEDYREKEIQSLRKYREIEIVPLSHMVSGFEHMQIAQTRLEQSFAVLRSIEALRLFAAGHEGKLPSSWEDVKEVPIPVDPFTNTAVSYHLEGDIAVLSIRFRSYAPIFSAKESGWENKEYRVKIAK